MPTRAPEWRIEAGDTRERPCPGDVEVLVRAFVYWGSLITLAVCLVMRMAIGVRRALADVAATPRSDAYLEARVSELEEVVVLLRGSLDRSPTEA